MEMRVLPHARNPADDAVPGVPPPSRRGSWRRRATFAALILTAIATAGGLTIRAVDGPAPRRAVSAQAAAKPGAVDVVQRAAAVDAMLRRRAQAVLRHRPDAFVADVDPRNPRLIARQRVLYGNLVQFGFDRLSYLPVREQYDAALEERRGASAYAVQVVMAYRINGIDATTVHTPLGYTFVRVDGRWVLTADDDLDHGLPVGSHREPWDTGPVLVRRAPRVLVVVERGEAGLARSLVRDVRSADYDVSKNAEDAVAMATAVYRTLPGETSSEGERGASYVVVNPRYRIRLTARILAHEFTHVATAPYGCNAPRWLVEGFAGYVEYLPMDGEPDLDLDRYRTRVRDTYLAQVIGFPSDHLFYTSVVTSYAIGWYAVDWLISQ